MPTAEELLTTTVCNDILRVDLNNRIIIIPKEVTNLGVESDDNVKLLHFELPRHYCATDLSEFEIRINYENAKGAGDCYDVKNAVIGEDMITFDWIVGRYACTYKGNVEFSLCLRDVTDGIVNREFNTTTAVLPVLKGLETGEAIIEQHIDILEQWHNDLFGTGDTVEQQIVDKGNEVMANIEGAVVTYVNENKETLRGPQGEKGDTGATGATGPQGPQGEKGDTGATGPKGPQGEKGDTGATGPQGEKGEKGDTGTQGPKGETGAGFKVLDYFTSETELNSSVTNPSAGDAYGVGTGEPYDIYIYSPTKGWVNNGALQGAQGESGATFIPTVSSNGDLSWTNDKGLTNPDTVNIKGPKGDTGATGPQGEKGDTGSQGPQGIQGEKGEKGDTGDPGPQGIQGLNGEDGEMPLVSATSTDGVSYVATVDGMDSLIVGKEIMIVPDCTTTVVDPTLNVNNLGAKYLRCPLTTNNVTTTSSQSESWIYSGKPVKVRWNGTYWVTDIYRVDANSLYGTVPIESGGTGASTAEMARTNLDVYSKTEVEAAITAAIGYVIGGSY